MFKPKMPPMARRCGIVMIAWATVVAATLFVLGAAKDPFFALGPTGQNQLFNNKIDNWGLYWLIMVYQVVNSCVAIVNLEVVYPMYATKSGSVSVSDVHTATFAVISFTAVTALVGVRLQLCQVDFFVVGLACNLGVSHYIVHRVFVENGLGEGGAEQPLLVQ